MNRKIVSGLFLSAIGIYILGPQSPIRVEAQESSTASSALAVDSQATPTAVASDGADKVGAGALVRSGAEHGTGQVAADGADHVGAKGLAADGADHVGANRLAADGSDRVGKNQVASNETRIRIGGIGSDAVASSR